MLQTIKEYAEEFGLLPKAVKIFFAAVILFAVSFAVYYGIGNAIANKKIDRLEKENRELNASTQSAMEKAAKAEKSAAHEALRAESLESQLKSLENKEKQTDEKIKNQAQKSNNIQLSLDRVRTSKPANIGTDELERKLCERYGCR